MAINLQTKDSKLEKIKESIKRTLLGTAGGILSPDIQKELGMQETPEQAAPPVQTNNYQTAHIEAQDLEGQLNSIWNPIESQTLSNQESKKIKYGVITGIVIASIFLLSLLVLLIVPNNKEFNFSEESLVVVDGNEVAGDKEELNVEDIELGNGIDDDTVKESPLLQSQSMSIVEYHISSGDTLETIARKFYGSGSYDNIQKIKVANNIRNSRLLQIGQKLIIPY